MTDQATGDVQRPHVGLMLYEGLSNDIEADFLAQLPFPGLRIQVMRKPAIPFAAAELYLPTAIALFMATGFLNGFLQKAGEDCYDAFKVAAISLWRRVQRLDISVVGKRGKISIGQSYSLSYSIIGELSPGVRFKFLIHCEVNQAAGEVGISAFLDLLSDLGSNRVSEIDREALLNLPTCRRHRDRYIRCPAAQNRSCKSVYKVSFQPGIITQISRGAVVSCQLTSCNPAPGCVNHIRTAT